MISRAYIGIGSNIEPERNIIAALKLLMQELEIVGISSFYESEAIGGPVQPAFINGVVLVETGISPRDLKFGVLRKIESQLGRDRTAGRFSPRTIDLDILLYDEMILEEPDLVLPDPDITVRPFIAIPVCEIDPNVILPGADVPISVFARKMNSYPMRRLEDFTSLLRSEIEVERKESCKPD